MHADRSYCNLRLNCTDWIGLHWIGSGLKGKSNFYMANSGFRLVKIKRSETIVIDTIAKIVASQVSI